MSAACTAWFYSPAKDRVTGLNVINKIVAGVDPPFCHVELQFPSGEACSIVMQGFVSLRKRAFDREFYTPVVVRADARAVEAALELARAHVEAGTRFGVLGGRTFCSKLVLDLLCDSGMLGGEKDAVTTVQSRMLTPSALFRLLQQRPCVAQPQVAISFVHTPRGAAAPAHNLAHTAVAFKRNDNKTLKNKQKENVPEETQLLLGA
jgi:hypothetical protein